MYIKELQEDDFEVALKVNFILFDSWSCQVSSLGKGKNKDMCILPV